MVLPLSMIVMNINSVLADDEFPTDDSENYLEIKVVVKTKEKKMKKLLLHLMKKT